MIEIDGKQNRVILQNSKQTAEGYLCPASAGKYFEYETFDRKRQEWSKKNAGKSFAEISRKDLAELWKELAEIIIIFDSTPPKLDFYIEDGFQFSILDNCKVFFYMQFVQN